MFALRIDLRRLRWFLVASVTLLSLAHLLTNVILRSGSDLFNLNEEGTLGTWFSTMFLALAAVGFWFVGRASSPTTRSGWRIGAGVLGLMSLDEVAQLHERVGGVIANHEGVRGPLFFAWVIPGAFVAIGLLGGLVIFVRRLARPLAVRLVVGAALFFLGAVGMEMVGGNEMSTGIGGSRTFLAVERSRTYLLTTAVEETLELLGEVIVVLAVAKEADRLLARGAAGPALERAAGAAGPPDEHDEHNQRHQLEEGDAIGLVELHRRAPADISRLTRLKDVR